MSKKPVEASNIAEMYRLAAENYGNLPAFATRKKALEWTPVSFKDLYEMGVNLATAMIELGVEQRTHVGILADNRFEWILADYGVQLSGAADVPRGTDVTDYDIEYILEHADVEICFVENKAMYEKIDRNRSKIPKLKHIIVMDQKTKIEGCQHIYDLVERGKILRDGGDRKVEERVAKIQPDDLYTLIYTSGTTGAPKGVMLMHSNVMHQLRHIPIDITTNDRILSVLPVWHIFERVFEMMAISGGCCTYYTSVRHIAEDMRNIQPTFMGSAPRLWENLYQRILDTVAKSHPVRRGLFHMAHFFSHIWKDATFFFTGRMLDVQGRSLFTKLGLALYHGFMWILFLPLYGFFNAAVLERLRQGTGGYLAGSVSGGGALPEHVDRFFNYIGIPVLEGYGMTETSPVLAVRTYKKLIIGTVGPIFPETELRIVDINTGDILFPDEKRPGGGRGLKGEIHAKGPQVMKGYYKNPEQTEKVLKDGWMNTGDLGMITYNDCVKIMGRSKDTVVLISGENIEPVPIENMICESAYIDQCMVVGQDQKFLGVLVVPSLDGFEKAGMKFSSVEEASKSEEAGKIIGKEIKHWISGDMGFKSFERVQDFRMVPKTFEVNDELTALSKLKRHIITDRYQHLIDEIYK